MRPTRDAWLMGVAVLTAQRSTCLRRRVGCVLTNERGHIIATGYNGVAAGMPHCNERQMDYVGGPCGDARVPVHPHACPGAVSPSGTNLDACRALHAEQNALLQCGDVYSIHTCYVTTSPCVTCIKLFLNTSCQRIIYLEEYAASHSAAGLMWAQMGRELVKYEGSYPTP